MQTKAQALESAAYHDPLSSAYRLRKEVMNAKLAAAESRIDRAVRYLGGQLYFGIGSANPVCVAVLDAITELTDAKQRIRRHRMAVATGRAYGWR